MMINTYAVHLYGFGAVGNSLLAKFKQIKDSKDGLDNLVRLREYRLSLNNPHVSTDRKTLSKQIALADGTPWRRRVEQDINSLEDFVDAFQIEAQRDLKEKVTPVLILCSGYKKYKEKPEHTFYRYAENPNIETWIKESEDKLNEIINNDPSPSGRLRELIPSYFGITQLGAACRDKLDEKILKKMYVLVLTNPTDITPFLFASASGISAERVLAPSDNDRTRFIVILENTINIIAHQNYTPVNSLFNAHIRMELDKVIKAVGPHSASNRITRNSLKEALNLIERIVPSEAGDYLKNLVNNNDKFEGFYNRLISNVAEFARYAFEGEKYVMDDTPIAIINVLRTLFPQKDTGEYVPQQVKAIVYDSENSMYAGNMISQNYERITPEERIASILQGGHLPRRRYNIINVFANDIETKEDFQQDILVANNIIKEMAEQGLCTLELNTANLNKRERWDHRPSVLQHDTSKVKLSPQALEPGEYIVTGIFREGSNEIGILKMFDDRVELTCALQFKATPRSFAYHQNKLFVGTGNNVCEIDFATGKTKGKTKQMLAQDIKYGTGRSTGFNSLLVVDDAMLATFPGIGIMRLWKDHTSKIEREIISDIKDAYVGSLQRISEKEVGVIIGSNIIATKGSFPRDKTDLPTAGNFVYDDYCISKGIMYAITHDGIIYKGKLSDGLNSIVFPREPLLLEKIFNNRKHVSQRDLVRDIATSGTYEENVIYKTNRIYVDTASNCIVTTNNISSENRDKVRIIHNDEEWGLDESDYPTYRFIMRIGDRLVGVAPAVYYTEDKEREKQTGLKGCIRFIDTALTSTEKKELDNMSFFPYSFAVEKINLME